MSDVYCDRSRIWARIYITKSAILACSPADLKSFGLSSEAERGFIVVDTEHCHDLGG